MVKKLINIKYIRFIYNNNTMIYPCAIKNCFNQVTYSVCDKCDNTLSVDKFFTNNIINACNKPHSDDHKIIPLCPEHIQDYNKITTVFPSYCNNTSIITIILKKNIKSHTDLLKIINCAKKIEQETFLIKLYKNILPHSYNWILKAQDVLPCISHYSCLLKGNLHKDYLSKCSPEIIKFINANDDEKVIIDPYYSIIKPNEKMIWVATGLQSDIYNHFASENISNIILSKLDNKYYKIKTLFKNFVLTRFPNIDFDNTKPQYIEIIGNIINIYENTTETINNEWIFDNVVSINKVELVACYEKLLVN